MVFAVVTGGGTSGHVIPALAILEALEESGVSRQDLRYVGSRRGIETTLMRSSEIESEFLPISGLQRSLSVRSVLRNMALLWRLPYSRLLARRLIKKWQPQVVVSVGGYASQPMASAARTSGIPLVCVSYDRVAGLATRRQSRHAQVCAVAFSDTPLPRAVHTGAPVRAQLRHLDVATSRDVARRELGIDPRALCVAIVGGSLGSGVLNSIVGALGDACSHLDNVVIYHVCGERNEADPLAVVPNNVAYVRHGYESRMAELYASTDVLIARAGASTVAEIATVGMASVLVPWSGAADNHQELNARWLADNGGAVVVDEAVIGTSHGIQTIVELMENAPHRAEIAAQAYALGEIHRGRSLVETIKNAAR